MSGGCVACGGSGCEHCKGGPGEQGLTFDEQELFTLRDRVRELEGQLKSIGETPIESLLWCPACGERHIDVGDFATKVHHTHACQHCGMVWRPCVSPTVGVRFLPGFKNAEGT